MLRRTGLPVLLLAVSLAFPGCGLFGGKTTIVQITNKITSLPAGQVYQFTANVQHDQKMGVTVSLSGAGTLLLTGPTATYIAPPAPPNPNSVTVTVTAANGSGVSDSDTFTITPAAGPVVSIAPTTFTVTAGGTPFTLTVSVIGDDPTDTLTAGVSSGGGCGGACGSFGSFTGTVGGGTYQVQYTPPASVTTSTQQEVQVLSSLANSTPGAAFVTINP